MGKVKLICTVDDAHLESMDSVASRAVKAGLEIEETMSLLGIITGQIDSEKLGNLKKVKGIAAVENDGEVKIAGPED